MPASLEMCSAIFEAVCDGLIIADITTGAVIDANPAALAMYGYLPAEFIGASLATYVHPTSQPAFIEALSALKMGGVFQAQMIHLRHDGSQFHVEIHSAAFSYQNQLRLLSVVRDISERVQAEQLLQQQVEARAREQSLLTIFHERQRLAQELHDAVNQSLFSAGLIAEVLPRLWERDLEAGRRALEDLHRLTRGALAEIRMLLLELRPSALTDGELGDLLRLLGNAFTGRSNIPVTVSILGQGALPTDVQVGFYRLCQEGLNNIAKHAEASHVELQLCLEVDRAELNIRDDGHGFNPDQIPSGHYGLSMMHERAEAIGAELTILSGLGRGTQLTLCWSKAPKPMVK